MDNLLSHTSCVAYRIECSLGSHPTRPQILVLASHRPPYFSSLNVDSHRSTKFSYHHDIKANHKIKKRLNIHFRHGCRAEVKSQDGCCSNAFLFYDFLEY